MKKKPVTSSEPPARRDANREIDPDFMALITPEEGRVEKLVPAQPEKVRKTRREAPVVDGVQLAPIPPRRRAPEDQNVTTFRGIPKSLANSIKRFALEINFPVGIAARLLLELGIKEYQEGRLSLEPKLCFKGWSLYPTAGNRIGRPIDPQQKNPAATTPAAYRSIPEGVLKAIHAIHLQIGVPKGEIARRFFEHALTLYNRGKLELPDPTAWLNGELTLIQVMDETE